MQKSNVIQLTCGMPSCVNHKFHKMGSKMCIEHITLATLRVFTNDPVFKGFVYSDIKKVLLADKATTVMDMAIVRVAKEVIRQEDSIIKKYGEAKSNRFLHNFDEFED